MTEDVLQDPEALRQLTAYDRDGARIGAVDQVYVNDLNRRPEWITVHTDPPGTHEGGVFIPLEGAAHTHEGVLALAYPLAAVRDAPRMEADQHLGLDQEQELYLHYGLATPADEPSGAPGVGDDRPTAPVVGDEEDLQGISELADDTPPRRLRKHVSAGPAPTAGSPSAE